MWYYLASLRNKTNHGHGLNHELINGFPILVVFSLDLIQKQIRQIMHLLFIHVLISFKQNNMYSSVNLSPYISVRIKSPQYKSTGDFICLDQDGCIHLLISSESKKKWNIFSLYNIKLVPIEGTPVSTRGRGTSSAWTRTMRRKRGPGQSQRYTYVFDVVLQTGANI